MTSRPTEPYSLAGDLKNIAKTFTLNTASGVRGNTVFYDFTTHFIKPDIGNEKGTVSLLDYPPPEIPKGMYGKLDAVGFFDSLHDFKSDFIDCQGVIKTTPDKLSYKKFGFSFLLNGGYPSFVKDNNNNLIIQDGYSYLNRKTRPLNQDNLENYFSIGNILNVISSPSKGKVYILPDTRGLTKPIASTLGVASNSTGAIYDSLAAIFDSYRDPNFGEGPEGQIKLIFDFQLNLFDIIQKNKNKNKFCLLYTAETITDPAPKMRFDGIDETFGYKNFYIENLDSTGRSYNSSSDGIGGNVDVTFKNLSPTSRIKIDKNTVFTVEAKYAYLDGTVKSKNTTGFDTVQMNTKVNSIDTIKNIIRNTIERAVAAVEDTFTTSFFTQNINNRQSFYRTFNTDMSSAAAKINYQKEYAIYYARKRLGDTLQGRVCKFDKLSKMTFNKISDDKTIVPHNSKATKDAVLVTHDRMLFSYAVISGVPAILDLKDNMILFVPPTGQNVSSTETAIVSTGTVPTPRASTSVINSSNTGLSSMSTRTVRAPKAATSVSNSSNTGFFSMSTRSRKPNTFGGAPYDDEETVDSILNNIDSVIRFLYLYSHGNSKLFYKDSRAFEDFMKNINQKLINKELKYRYIGDYDGNILLIGTENDNNAVRYPDAEVDYLPLAATSTFVNIKNGTDYLIITRTYNDRITRQTTEPKNVISSLLVTFKKGQTESTIGKSGGLTADKITKFFSKKYDIYSSLQKLSQVLEQYNESELPSELSPEDLQTLYDEFTPASSQLVTYPNQLNMRILIIIAFLIAVGAGFASIYTSSSRSGGGDEDNILDRVLGADFDTLYDSSKLLENNITTMYFLFSMLTEFELSFVNYQEGIDTYYTKIDESAILSDMVGITNLIPHNIELYVFLKLILNDFSQANVSKNINYSLLEYYLYLYSLSNKNILYSRLQNLKSYLNINYTIDVNPEKVPDIVKKIQSNPITLKSWRYFINVMKNAEAITNQVIAENYDAEQAGNFDIIYQNVEKYNLKLAGFTDMKNDFISKTFNIVSSMASAGLLNQYINIANKLTGQTPSDVARGVSKPYQMVPTPSMVQQPISVGVGGKKYKKSLRKTRKFKKRTHKRKINNKTKRHRK